MGRGRGQSSQARTSKIHGHVYAITPQDALTDQSVIHGTFLLFCFWVRVLFDFGASYSFITTSCVEALGLEVKTLKKSLYVNSPLGTRVSIDQICQDYELEISEILLTVDLRVMDMSEFDIILGMDWLTAHRVVIDCDRRRVTAYTPEDKHDVLPQAVYDSR